MKVLIACEFSGVVRRAFAARGHTAVSCDFLPSLDQSDMHYQGDVLDIIHEDWDMMIAHPPCTYLCNSGVRWLTGKDSKPGRWEDMEEAAGFFMFLLQQEIPRICVENPVPHKHAGLPPYSQLIQPWQFGHPDKKGTCLWLRGLPELEPTEIIPKESRVPSIHVMGETKDRPMKRSLTYEGIAAAMAQQWG